MNKKSKILILGGSGFAGRTLTYEIRKRGYYFVIQITRKECDLRYQPAVVDIFKDSKPEYVFNCAGKVGGIKENMNNQFSFLLDNLLIQANVIAASIEENVKKVINLGSSCIYPKDYKQPLKEEYLLQAPPEPTNEGYAIAKIAGLKLCEYANKENSKTKFISLMPSNLYGPGDSYDLDRSHVLSALVRKIIDAKRIGNNEVPIWGSGKSRREFLYIKDLCDGMIWAMENLEKTETFLNIGPGEDISVKDLAKKIAKIVGYTGNFNYDTSKPDGMLKKCLDVTKINKLGWGAKTDFETGLREAIKDYQNNF